MSAAGVARTKCRACGRLLTWTADDLRYHALRVERGEHAASACDDDHAAESRPWTAAELRRVLRRVQP